MTDKMYKMIHGVNPVNWDPSSGMFFPQSVTFETMRIARDFARGQVDIVHVSAQYPEDRPSVPNGFLVTPDLQRSALDLKKFETRRKLPWIGDILDRLYNSMDADYMIYTNTDIALMPHFYVAVSRIIESGYDAFVINRRVISKHYRSINDISLMFSDFGKPHPGYDCFVFRKDVYPNYKLGDICIGAPLIGLALILNVIAYATKFKEFKEEHLTFHIGEEWTGQRPEYREYGHYNESQILRILKELDVELGALRPTHPLGSFLYDLRTHRDLSFTDELFIHHQAAKEANPQSIRDILKSFLFRGRSS